MALVATMRSTALRLAANNVGVISRHTAAGVPSVFKRLASNKIKVTFVKPNGEAVTVTGQSGDSLLDVAHEHNIDIEGACGGECACSTCHVILEKPFFDSLPAAEEEEEDMLDLALGLTNTSRLGCQVILTKDMTEVRVKLPAETANYLDAADAKK